MPSINSQEKQSNLPQGHDLEEPINSAADDFEAPQEGGPEEEPNEPVSGDGGEGYPIRGAGPNSAKN